MDATNVALAGGIATSASAVLLALIRARSGDRETVIHTQQQHMDRLTLEREEAIRDRDGAWDAVEKWRGSYETELGLRIQAQAERQAFDLAAKALAAQIAQLQAEVLRLQEGP